MQINNFFYPIYSLIKDKFITIIKNTDKKILIAASIAFSFLTACFVIKSFLSRRVVTIEPRPRKIYLTENLMFQGECKKFLDLPQGQLLPHGKGKLHYEGKLIYEGEFEKGKPHGKGTIFFPEKSVNGEFDDSLKDLEKIIESNRENWKKFEGRFENGMPKRSNDDKVDNQVNLTFLDGNIFEGKLDEAEENNLYTLNRAEKGTIKYKNGTIFTIIKAAEVDHKGEILITYPNQESYSGQYVLRPKQDEEDKGNSIYTLEGNGEMSYANGAIYKGKFVNGLPNDVAGEMTWKTDTIYKGQFVNGQLTGAGKMTWKTGETYKGGFVNSVPNGRGQMTYTNGESYKGEFVNGVPHGAGKKINAKGEVYAVGFFENGKLSKNLLPESKNK